MGIKSMSLQMIPWCFHLLTNHISCVHIKSSTHDEPPIRTIKLIKSDGLVKIYHRPINVSDVMNEFPKHLVCHSDSFYIGQKIPHLSETEELQLGHNYFLLPKHLFQSVLSFVTIASFANTTAGSNKAQPQFLKKTASFIQPFVIRKTPSGSLQIRVSDEFISSLIQKGGLNNGKDVSKEEEEEEEERGRICSTAQLQKDYTRLVVGLSKQWKPKLETIRESKRKRFGIKRRKTSQSKEKKIQKSEHLHVVAAATSSSSKKIKKEMKSNGKKGL